MSAVSVLDRGMGRGQLMRGPHCSALQHKATSTSSRQARSRLTTAQSALLVLFCPFVCHGILILATQLQSGSSGTSQMDTENSFTRCKICRLAEEITDLWLWRFKIQSSHFDGMHEDPRVGSETNGCLT